MPKIQTYTNVGAIATGDKLLGERVDGTTVRFTYAQGTMNGTSNRITVTSGVDSFTFNISASYVGQNTITTLGTITTGVWNGTAIANANLANSAVANLSGTNTGDQTISLTGNVTGSGAGSFAATIANDAVTYAKMQNVSATDKLLGRSTAGSGDVEEITCTAAGRALIDDAAASDQRTTLGLGTLATQSGTFSGTSSGTNTGDQTITLTGDVTGSGVGSFAATIANAAVTLGKMANMATASLLGRNTAGSGAPEVITDIPTAVTVGGQYNYRAAGTDVPVTDGGTGVSTLTTAYAPVCAGTTATGAVQVASTGLSTSGNVLTSNGASSLPSFQAPTAGAGSLKSFQVFTSGTAATYTRPAGVASILVEVIGGGGGGGGVAAAPSSGASGGAGGGSGGYARLWVAAASATYTYTVGALGAGGTAGNNAGSTGGTTTFSASSLQATGGVGGSGSGGAGITSGGCWEGGAPGVGTNGNFNASGAAGANGVSVLGNGCGGGGGSSIYGGGAVGEANSLAAGNVAGSYGSGGGGAYTGATTDRAGGNGSAGLIIVWEYS